jgi:hypothetical protein
VRLPSGVIMHDVSIHLNDDRAWASPPSTPQIGRDGTHMQKGGKPQNSPIISVVLKEVRDKFSPAVLDVLRLSHPEALA